MTYSARKHIDKALRAWQQSLPHWVRALAEIADHTSLVEIERTTGLRHQFCSRMLRNTLRRGDRRRMTHAEQQLRLHYPDFFAYGLTPNPQKFLETRDGWRNAPKESGIKTPCPIFRRPITADHCASIASASTGFPCRGCKANPFSKKILSKIT
jgi:hypothetical protein